MVRIFRTLQILEKFCVFNFRLEWLSEILILVGY